MAYPTTASSTTDLVIALPSKFEEARQSGQLFYFPSTSKDVISNGHKFRISCCPALNDKAKAKEEILSSISKSDSPDRKRQRKDPSQSAAHEAEKHQQNPKEPFRPPYVPELFVGYLDGIDGEPGLSVLLNKYAVLRDHALLCSTEYEPQSLPPTPHQLALAYLFILAASRHPTRPRRLLGFYNGGSIAGASQTWRHIQLIDVTENRPPLDDWFENFRPDSEEEATIHPNLPHLHIVHPVQHLKNIPFPPSPSQMEELVDAITPPLMKCLDLVFQSLRMGQVTGERGWNMLFTLDHIHFIPRSASEFPLDQPHSPIEMNSLGYAGMMLVRSEESEQALLNAVEGKDGLMSVLRHCGVPREWGEKAMEALKAHRGQMEDMMQQSLAS